MQSASLDQSYTIAETAEILEINTDMFRWWTKECQADEEGHAFRGNGKLMPEQEEIGSLKVQIR